MFTRTTLTHMLYKLKIDRKDIKHVSIQINNKNIDKRIIYEHLRTSIIYEPHFRKVYTRFRLSLYIQYFYYVSNYN